MLWIYLFIAIIGSETAYNLASAQQQGFIRHPAGNTILCYFFHLCFLVLSIWYLGWLFGIIVFAMDLFGIIHATVGWILNIPTLLSKSNNSIYFYSATLPTGVISILDIFVPVFLIYSFFATKYKSLYHVIITLFDSNISILFITLGIVCALSVLRFIVAKLVSNS